MKTIGDRIRELRDLRNMTQQQLADGMGESSGRVIYNWEKGISRPDSDKIVRLIQSYTGIVNKMVWRKF